MKRHHSHIPMLFFAIVATLFVGALYFYVLNKINNAVDQTAELDDSIALHELNKGRELEIVKLYQSRSEDWSKLQDLFISTEDPLTFIESLEALGTEASSTVTIGQVNVDGGKVKSSVKTGAVSAHLDVVGSWQALERTLKLAENMPYQISIDKVRLDSSLLGDDPTKRTWHLSFDLRAVTYNPNASSTLKSNK